MGVKKRLRDLGGSIAVSIPKRILEFKNWDKGTKVILRDYKEDQTYKSNSMVIEKVESED